MERRDNPSNSEGSSGRDGVGGGFHDLVGMHTEVVSEEVATAWIDATDEHLNGHGTVHGGVLAALADAAMGAAVAAQGQTPVTVEMKVTYLEPAPKGTITASAKVLRRGSRIIIVQADLTDGDGSDVAHAIATFTPI